jgi:hypothetical protein
MDATLRLKAEQFAGDIANQAKTLEDLNEMLRTLAKSAMERMLDTEMDVHLGRGNIAVQPAVVEGGAGNQTVTANRRNGHSKKTVRGDRGVSVRDSQGIAQRPPGLRLEVVGRRGPRAPFAAPVTRVTGRDPCATPAAHRRCSARCSRARRAAARVCVLGQDVVCGSSANGRRLAAFYIRRGLPARR